MNWSLPGEWQVSQSTFWDANRWWTLSLEKQCPFRYESLRDLLVDYSFRHAPERSGSQLSATPLPYRSSFRIMFNLEEDFSFFVTFHDSLLAAITALQEWNRFVSGNERYFSNQGTGVHHFDVQANDYRFLFGGRSPEEMLNTARSEILGSGDAYDLFISHASEDKEACVRPLAQRLAGLGLKVWYDEFELRPGDSLRRSIDRGVAMSRCGLVVVSPHFIRKNWTAYEMDGLVAKMVAGETYLIPIWLDVDRAEVLKFSPFLADRVAIEFSSSDLDRVASQIFSQLRF